MGKAAERSRSPAQVKPLRTAGTTQTPLLGRSASPRFGQRHLAQSRELADQGFAKTPYSSEFVRLFGERRFVHVQTPVQLDLNGVDASGGTTVTNGRVATAVRLVVREP